MTIILELALLVVSAGAVLLLWIAYGAASWLTRSRLAFVAAFFTIAAVVELAYAWGLYVLWTGR